MAKLSKAQKEILFQNVKDEKQVLNDLRDLYAEVNDDICKKVQELYEQIQNDPSLTSKAYQLEFQYAMKSQIEKAALKLQAKQYGSVKNYIYHAYERGYVGVMYDLADQGIPFMMPINQKKVIEAMTQDSKLSKSLYESLGYDVDALKKEVNHEIARGFASSLSYMDVSRNIQNRTNVGMNKAMRIARTEAHRVNAKACLDAQHKAKGAGANIVKQWCSTLDDRTRPSHQMLDGQIRELDEPFTTSDGLEAQYPSGFGVPWEDINCRCTMLQRAKWALDEDELKRLQERAEYYELDKAKDLEEFTKKYIEGIENENDEKIKDILNQKADIESELPMYDNTQVFSNIWKDDVTLDDWKTKQGSIQAKKDYFVNKLKTLDPWEADYSKFQDLLNDLNFFDSEGSQYWDLKDKIAKLDKELAKLMNPNSSDGIFSEDAYGVRKDEAYRNRFKTSTEADKYYRPQLDRDWDTLKDEEKYSVYEYTKNSHPINKPLSGYSEKWDRYYYEGLGNVPWNREDGWRYIDYEFNKFGKNGHVTYREVVKDLTNAIEKTTFDKDVLAVRGSGNNGLAGLVESGGLKYDDVMRALDYNDVSWLKSNIEGGVFQSHSFMSTAMAKVPDAFEGEVYYEVYMPKGTKCIYAEPQSYFGSTTNGAELYKTGQSYTYVGDESEIIIQRGTSFKITSIERKSDPYSHNSNTWTVKMEVVNQPDYFKTGYEHTFDEGSTSEK